MSNEKQNPGALGGAHRAGNIKTVGAGFDEREPTRDALAFQVAFIAHRYRLSPCMSRLVCHLAHIGGRLA